MEIVHHKLAFATRIPFRLISPEYETDYKNVLRNILASFDTLLEGKVLVMYLHPLKMVLSVLSSCNSDDTTSDPICDLIHHYKKSFWDKFSMAQKIGSYWTLVDELNFVTMSCSFFFDSLGSKSP